MDIPDNRGIVPNVQIPVVLNDPSGHRMITNKRNDSPENKLHLAVEMNHYIVQLVSRNDQSVFVKRFCFLESSSS